MEQKPWYQSRAVWGSVVAILASLLKASGHELPVELQGQVTDVVLSAFSVIGAVVALWGRVKATKAIGKA